MYHVIAFGIRVAINGAIWKLCYRVEPGLEDRRVAVYDDNGSTHCEGLSWFHEIFHLALHRSWTSIFTPSTDLGICLPLQS
jgi:hypothetical protein